MKKLILSIFALVSMPMSMLAQEGPQHLFPEVTFTYQGVTYTVPAWDALASMGERVQSTFVKTNPDEGGEGSLDPSGPGSPGGGTNIGDRNSRTEYNGIIVATACALPTDGGKPLCDFSAGNITIDGYEHDASTVTYGDIFPDMDGEPLGAYTLFSTAKITGDYSIPEEAPAFEDDVLANKYNIIGVGDAAYANKSWSHDDNTLYMQATKITIPAHIKFLGKFSFFADGYAKEIIIPRYESEITVFPEGVFSECMRIKRVRFPELLERVEAHAFGGCKVLRLIYLYAQHSPTIANDAFEKYSESTATDFDPGKCAGWAYDIETVKNFRNEYPEVWNQFLFRMPMTWPESGYSTFFSELPIFKYYPKDDGDDNVVLAHQADGPLTMYYAKMSDTNTIGQNADGQYQINLTTFNGTYAAKSMGLLLTGTTENLYVAPTNFKNIKTWGNYLKGSDEPMDMTSIINNNPGSNVYLLKDGKFRNCSGGTLKANKAYMIISKEKFKGRNEAKEISFVFDGENGETDGVYGLEAAIKEAENSWYTLQGVRVEVPTRGIFIRGGKKYVFK